MKTRALPTALTDALKAAGPLDEIQVVADYLRELMEGLHGGEWRFSINHEKQLVLISRSWA